MQKRLIKWQAPIIVALLLHALLLVALVVELPAERFQVRAASASQLQKIIHVAAVTSSEVQATIKAIAHQKAVEKEKQLAKARKRQAKVLALKRAKALAKKRAAELVLKRKKLALKRQKARLARKRMAEKKRKALLAKKQHEKKLAKLHALSKSLQDKMLAEQMRREQQHLNQVEARAQQGLIDQYKSQVLAAIQSNWRIPSVNDKLSCIYQVNLAPGGVVISVKLQKGSGNAALDQSAKVAIYRSSPLPVPKDPAAFDAFRHLVLTLRPTGYLTSASHVQKN